MAQHDLTREPDLAARVSRRFALTSSSIALGAFVLPNGGAQNLLASEDQKRTPGPAAKQAIVILLQGGCSHHDTWDLKSDAPAEIRGEFKPISTSVAGYQCSESI